MIVIYIDVELEVSAAEMGAEPAKEMEAAASPPQSWELADLKESMSKLLAPPSMGRDVEAQEEKARGSSPDSGGDLPEAINQVDQFLRDALQNPRERLTSKCFLLLQGLFYFHSHPHEFDPEANMQLSKNGA